MSTVYKVWAVVEEINEPLDSYEDITEPAMLGEFETAEEATAFLDSLDIYPKGEKHE